MYIFIKQIYGLSKWHDFTWICTEIKVIIIAAVTICTYSDQNSLFPENHFGNGN